MNLPARRGNTKRPPKRSFVKNLEIIRPIIFVLQTIAKDYFLNLTVQEALNKQKPFLRSNRKKGLTKIKLTQNGLEKTFAMSNQTRNH